MWGTFHVLRAAANALSAPPGEYGRKAKLKGIDGGPHKRRSMRLNSMQREEPYLGLTVGEIWQRCQVRKGPKTGGAWLSSARVVRCWVKSRNERNPRRMLPASKVGDSYETAGVNSEEGGDDVKSSCPLCLGLHACYNGRYKGLRYRKVERIPKSRSQFGLGSATRPHEVGVASNRRSATLR